jgi:uncharacterized protein
MPDLQSIVMLCLCAAAGGAVNAVAGGGTLLTFPALVVVLQLQMETAKAAVVANATSTLALCPGSISAMWGYRREMADLSHWIKLLLPPSIIGGVAGSLLVVVMPPEHFKALVPWLILTATLLFLLQPLIAKWLGIGQAHAEPHGRTKLGVVLFQFLVAVYGGYFGAGIGILMLSSLAMIGLADIHRMNALKTLLASVINGMSVLIFMGNDFFVEKTIDWPLAILMAISAIIGGYAGARVARKLDRRLVRGFVVCIGLTLTAYYFWKH